MIHFRSYKDLNQTIKDNIYKIPKDVDLVVGIPRSGLLAANMVALAINKPLVDLDGFLLKKHFSGGLRLSSNSSSFSKIKKVLVIDDSLNSGASLAKAKLQIEKSNIKKEIVYGIIYLRPGQESKVDLYFEHCFMPRVFEWNIFHHDIIKKSCVDIDGILCNDPSEEENDDGPKYLSFIQNVQSKIVPTVEVFNLVTCRLEKYRKQTEKWLEKNNIKYKNLIMMQYKTKEERILHGNHAKYKAEKYLNSGADLFIESDYEQAREIFRLTNKDVFSFENSVMFSDNVKMQRTNTNFRTINSKTIAIFSHSSQLGGSERSMLELILELREKNIFSHVILPGAGPLEKELANNSISYEVINFNWWAKLGKMNFEEIISNNSNSFNNLINYLPELSQLNPDLVYSNTLVSPWGAIAANYLDVPHIWHVREYGELDHKLNFDAPYNEIINFTETYSDEIIVNSKSVAEHISKYLKTKKPKIAYNYVTIDKNLLKEKIVSPFKIKNSLKVLICGTLSRGKNQLEALRSIKELIKNGTNIELLLVGGVADENYLQEINDYIAEHQIKNYVHILNFVANPYPYFKISDVVLISSKKEAYGRTAIEAMLLKKPVVATLEGGTKEIIKDNMSGFIYEADNNLELQKILLKLQDKTLQKKIGLEGYKSLKQINNKDQYGYKIAEIIRNTIKNHRPNNQLTKIAIYTFIKSLENLQKKQNELENQLSISQKSQNDLREQLTTIFSSKTYRIWQAFNKVKKYIHDFFNF